MEKEIEELKNDNKFLKSVIDYFMVLEMKRNPHLGRPRLSDMNCLFCVGYIALNPGAYGENLTQEMIKEARDKIVPPNPKS